MNIKIEKIMLESIDFQKNPKIHLENNFKMNLSIEVGVRSDSTFSIGTASKIKVQAQGIHEETEEVILNLKLEYAILLTVFKTTDDEEFSLDEFKNNLNKLMTKKIFSSINNILKDAGIAQLGIPNLEKE